MASEHSGGLGTAVLRRWPIALALVLLGAAGGVTAAHLRPTVYTSEVRLAVGQGDLASQAVPGFAMASQELAANYARFVTEGPVRSALPAGVEAHVLTITASPVPESNVVRVEARATDPRSSTVAAAEAGRQLVEQVDKIVAAASADRTLDAYRSLSAQVGGAQQQQLDAQAHLDELKAQSQSGGGATRTAARRDLPAARKALVDANVKLADLQVQQGALAALYQTQIGRGPNQNGLSHVSPAAVSGDDTASRAELYGLGGAFVGGAAAAAVAAAGNRRRPARVRRGSIAGAPPGPWRQRDGLEAGSFDNSGEGRAGHQIADTDGQQVWTSRR